MSTPILRVFGVGALLVVAFYFFFSSRRRHTRFDCDWSSDVCSSDLKTITYAQYFYEDGPVSRDIANALSERGLAGVGVNVLLDAFGALGIPGEYVDMMRRAGCDVEFFRPLGHLAWHRASTRNPRRIFVV